MFLVALAGTAARVADTGPLTTTALIVIAVFATLVVLGILWGARQKRIRAAGEREELSRNEALAAHPPTVPAPPPPGDAGTASAVPPTTRAPQPEPVTSPGVAATKPPQPAKPKPAAKPAARQTRSKPAAPAKAAPRPASASAAATKPAPPPVEKAAATPAASPATGYGLIDVKGLGPKAVPMLEALGVGDIAALGELSAARAAEIDGQLGALSGRLSRDRWVDQAKLLAAGEIAEFEKIYGKL